MSIANGELAIGLENSRKWYDRADLDVLCQEL